MRMTQCDDHLHQYHVIMMIFCYYLINVKTFRIPNNRQTFIYCLAVPGFDGAQPLIQSALPATMICY